MENQNSHLLKKGNVHINPYNVSFTYKNLCSVNYRLNIVSTQYSDWLLYKMDDLYLQNYKINIFKNSKELSTKEVKAANAEQPPYRNVMYYGDWSIYSGQKNFTPDKIDGSLITHLNFAFMDADANGDLITTDTWADYENPNVGFSVGTDNKYAGVLGAMVLLRQKYPNMKIGVSVGGWTRSGDFPKIAASETTRKNFAFK